MYTQPAGLFNPGCADFSSVEKRYNKQGHYPEYSTTNNLIGTAPSLLTVDPPCLPGSHHERAGSINQQSATFSTHTKTTAHAKTHTHPDSNMKSKTKCATQAKTMGKGTEAIGIGCPVDGEDVSLRSTCASLVQMEDAVLRKAAENSNRSEDTLIRKAAKQSNRINEEEGYVSGEESVRVRKMAAQGYFMEGTGSDMFDEEMPHVPRAISRGQGIHRSTDTDTPGAFAEGGMPIFHLQRDQGPHASSDSNGADPNIPNGAVPGSTDEEGLVEALAIEDLSRRDLEEAEPVVPEGPKTRGTSRFGTVLGIIFAFCAGLLVGIPTAVMITKNKEDPGNVLVAFDEPDQEPQTPQDYVLDLLREQELEDPLQLGHASAQALAFEWLLQDPNLLQYSSERVIQRYALATFYHSTGGPLWTYDDDWLSYDVHECLWYIHEEFFGFVASETSESGPCSVGSDAYERLWLPNNTLAGTLPDEFYALTSLQSANFLFNSDLHGTLSTNIGRLTEIEKFSVVFTSVAGTIPSQVGLLHKLKLFYLNTRETSENRFHGTVPDEFWQLTSMEEISLMHHNFTGKLPTDLSHMTDLKAIGMVRNSFSGSIPTEWGLLSNLRFLYMWGTRVSGTIPSELGLLRSLEALHLSNNQLVGSIPSQLGNIPSLKEIVLANNTNLEGPIPSEIGRLSAMFMLFLAHNPGLGGTFPTELYNLTKVKAFDITDTNITGDLPEWMAQTQNETPWLRYQTECRRWFPCPDW